MAVGESYGKGGDAFKPKSLWDMKMDTMYKFWDTENPTAKGNPGVKRMEITPLANGNQGVKSNMPNPMQFQQPKNPFKAQGPGY